MPLIFQDTNQVKKHVSIDANTDFASLVPEIEWAERTYLARYLGPTLYLQLLDFANNPAATSAPLTALLANARPAVANLAVAHFLTTGMVSISDMGVRIRVDGSNKTAFEWQKNQVERELFDRGYNSLEQMLAFLEEKKADYPGWLNPAAAEDTLVATAVEFSRHANINQSRRLFVAMLPAMRKVQTFTVSLAVTSEVVDGLVSARKADTLTAKQTALLALLQPAVACLTLARALVELPVVVRHDSVVLREMDATNGGIEATAKAERDALQRQMHADGLEYLDLAVLWLQANANETDFPTFHNKMNDAATAKQAGKRIYGAF